MAQDYNLLIIEDDPYYVLQYREGLRSCTFIGPEGQGYSLHPADRTRVTARPQWPGSSLRDQICFWSFAPAQCRAVADNEYIQRAYPPCAACRLSGCL